MEGLSNLGGKQTEAVYWRVIDQILTRIRSREYRPGMRIPTEKELMEEMGISRSSVREAIKMLSALGIVTIRRGEGTYISDAAGMISMDSIAYTLLMANSPLEDVLEFRYNIENMMLRIAVDKVTDRDIQELEGLIDEAQQAYEEGNIIRVQELDMQFHLRVLESTRNPFVIRMLKGVYEFIGREMISKNPNIGSTYERSKFSHINDVAFLKTKSARYIEKNKRYENSKVWLDYYSDRS